MSRSDTIQKIEKNKIIVITRGIYGEELLRLSEALYEGGIRAFEITYDPADPNTLDTIRKNVEALDAKFQGKLLLGVGTVLNREQVRNAKEAGAKLLQSGGRGDAGAGAGVHAGRDDTDRNLRGR